MTSNMDSIVTHIVKNGNILVGDRGNTKHLRKKGKYPLSFEKWIFYIYVKREHIHCHLRNGYFTST